MTFRDMFWRQVTVGVVKHSNVIQKHRAPADEDYVRPIPIERRYPGLVGTNACFSENTPQSEVLDKFSLLALKEVLAAKETFGLAEEYPDPFTDKGCPYPNDYMALQAPPQVPEDFADGADKLAGVARRGSFSMFTKPEGDGYKIDMSALETMTPRAPFVQTGGVAHFKKNTDGTLSTTHIDFQGTTTKPGDAGWDMAVKRILVALNTYGTFIDHLTHVHILGAGTWTICTHLSLPARHPLRILMQPFVIETMRVNNDNIDGLILSEHSNVPMYSGYSLGQLNELMRKDVNAFDVRWLDAEWRATQAGQLDNPNFPTMQSALALWGMFKRLTNGWVAAHLPTIDLETRIWAQELNARVPNGVGKLLGITDFETELKPEHIAHLLCVGMFTSSVWHHIVANMPRDYEMQFDIMPPAMDKDGHPSLGIVLEKRNSITIASLLRYKLVDDTVFLPQETMKKLWADFQTELREYEAALDKEPALKPYRVKPSDVPSSVHA